MEIIKGIKIIGNSLWIEKSKTLIIADLHIGYEEALNKQGILIPRIMFREIEKELKRLVYMLKPKIVVINGDLKHEFGEISKQEWKETLKILDLIENSKVILVKGNHDTILEPIAKKKNLKIVEKYEFEKYCIVHGNRIIKTNAKILIIGHEHPAISLNEGIKAEKYKCFILGRWKGKILIVMPSFLPITEGTDIRNEQLLSPYLQQSLDNFEIFIIGDKTYRFGKLKNIHV